MTSLASRGELLWRYQSNRSLARIANVVMALMVLCVTYVVLFQLFDKVESTPAKALVLMFLLAGLGGLYGSLRLLTRPVDLLTVYRGGLLFHRGEKGYSGNGFFVPWGRIQSLAPSSRERIDERGSATIPTMGFEVTCSPDWSPPAHLTSRQDGASALMHLDLRFGGKNAEQLLARLETLNPEQGDSAS